MDFNKINSYYRFIEIMKSLNEEEKYQFLYNYFYQNVDYNYYEWLYGFLSYGIDAFKPQYIEYKGELNPKHEYMLLCCIEDTKTYNDDSIYEVESDDEIPLNEIIKLRQQADLKSLSSIRDYKRKVTKLLEEDFFYDIENEEVKKELHEIFKRYILDPSLIPTKYDHYKVIYDITWMIYKSFKEKFANGDAEYHNGLIKKGVCRHYANFIKKVLDDLNIPSLDVIGASGLFHEWNIVMIDNELKVIDITREIHLRNKLTDEYNKGDWYLISIDEMFRLEPDRDIREINGISLEPYITKDNYQEQLPVLYNAFKQDLKTKKRKKKK